VMLEQQMEIISRSLGGRFSEYLLSWKQVSAVP